MVAPQSSSNRVVRLRSARLRPGAGAGVRALAPPVSRQISRSRSVEVRAISSMRPVARTPASSGTGCPASA